MLVKEQNNNNNNNFKFKEQERTRFSRGLCLSLVELVAMEGFNLSTGGGHPPSG